MCVFEEARAWVCHLGRGPIASGQPPVRAKAPPTHPLFVLVPRQCHRRVGTLHHVRAHRYTPNAVALFKSELKNEADKHAKHQILHMTDFAECTLSTMSTNEPEYI